MGSALDSRPECRDEGLSGLQVRRSRNPARCATIGALDLAGAATASGSAGIHGPAEPLAQRISDSRKADARRHLGGKQTAQPHSVARKLANPAGRRNIPAHHRQQPHRHIYRNNYSLMEGERKTARTSDLSPRHGFRLRATTPAAGPTTMRPDRQPRTHVTVRRHRAAHGP